MWTPIFHHIHTRVGVQIPNRWLERKLILIGSRKRSRFAFCALASDERKINMILKKYTTSAVRLNQQHSTLGICTDKGWANSLPLYCTILTTAANTATVTAPVIARPNTKDPSQPHPHRPKRNPSGPYRLGYRLPLPIAIGS